MKKGTLWNRLTAAVLCTALALALPAQAVWAEDGKQDAEPQNPWDKTADTSWYSDTDTEFSISTPQQLAGLAQLVNAGNTFAGKKIRLENDIYLNADSLPDDSDDYEEYEHAWTPIGATKGSASEDIAFEGYFDGGKHTIYNMQTFGDSGGGLFGRIGEQGFVKCVEISQGILYGGACIADEKKGTIAFCSNNSRIEDQDISREAGGICNTNSGLVYGCTNYGELWGKEIGGIVGRNKPDTLATVSQCSNHGIVNAVRSGAGIVNRNGSWVINCYNVGEVAGVKNETNRVLGLAGIVFDNMDPGRITNSYSAGKFSKGETNAGRIYAQNRGKVTNCYAVESEFYDNADDTVSVEELKSPEFVAKLDQQTNSVLSVWRQDTDFKNEGMPITAADVSFASGQCKIQPEAWILNGKKEIQVDLEQQTYHFSFETYYNEAEPVVTIADTQIAQVEKKEKGWDIQLKKAGSTNIKVHFEETENNSSADYELTLTVTEKTLPQEVKIEKISLSVADVSLDAGKTLQLQAEIIPANAANKNLKWTSDNEAAATVENGLVHAVGVGTAAITAESQDGSGVRASCVVSVKKEPAEDGSQTPGGSTPGDGTPGDNTPGSGTTDGNTPGSGTPGGNTPGSGTTDGNTPGSGTPGGNTPGSGTPGGGTTGGNTPGNGTPGGNTPGGGTGGNTSGGSTGGNTSSGGSTGGNTAGSGTSGGTSGGNTSGSTPGNNAAGGTNADGAGSGNNSNSGNGNTGGNGQTANKPEESIQVQLLYYIVDFNANMGTNLSRKNMTLLNNDALGILPKVQRKNHTFSGWYTQKDGGVKVSSATRLNAGTMLFARWQEVVKPSRVKTTALKSVKKGQVKASFQKVSGAAGYQVQYAANNKFTAAKTKTAGAAAKAKTLTGLKAGKKYYVRVRAYTVDSMGNKIYGSFSTPKSVKVKA